jgi:hypothetical protein
MLLTLILTIALIALLMFWRRKDLNLEQQLRAVNDANAVLKNTLGELTMAITKKEKEIDDLHLLCATREVQPNSRSIPSPEHEKRSYTAEIESDCQCIQIRDGENGPSKMETNRYSIVLMH